MDVLLLTTPIVVMVGLLALMQRVESRMSERAPVRVATGRAASRAEAVRARHAPPSPLLAGAPLAVIVVIAVVAAGAVVRMAA